MRIKGIYDGEKVVLLEAISLSPNTVVEVIIPDEATPGEDAYWEMLAELGLVVAQNSTPTSGEGEEDFTPIMVEGEPLSQTIIEERR
ncbi:MAG: hypothetical protein M3220_21190 [Chloroflexota bacterium]|nr:hypothetical protein [Chloroflexota bacterium]